MSDSEDLSRFAALSLEPPEIYFDDRTNLNADDAFDGLTNFESIQNKQKSPCIVIQASDDSQIVNAVKGVENKVPHESEWDKLSTDKCLSKCETFPCSARRKCSNDMLDGVEGQKGDLNKSFAQSGKPPCSRSVSLPFRMAADHVANCTGAKIMLFQMVQDQENIETPFKLVSAMKGSRAKLGAPPRNLTVVWAPDVYDPVPTAVCHVPNRKPQRYRNDNKRNGKNKQKNGGKASRSKGKEKKQSRKSGATSSKPFKFVDDESIGPWSAAPQGSALDFGVGPKPCYDSQLGEAVSGGPRASNLDFGVSSHDPFCGRSFLKNSVTPVHFPVTEAT